jgi:ABC-type iron transport system FetAB ATPase subunit
LLKIIASLLSPTSGQIFCRSDIATLSPETYRQQVSYCAQTPALFGDSVYDNLIFPWQIRHQQPDPRRWSLICSALALRKIRWKNQSMSFPGRKAARFADP